MRRSRRPAPAPGAWRRAVAPLLGPAPLNALTVGSTGVWTAAQRRRARESLKGLARAVRVLPDLELAHAAAFAGGSGVLVLAGTGSVALAQGRDGKLRRAGGWGPLLGDEGSAFWIGKRALADPALSRTLKLPSPLELAHGDFPVRRVAALARRVLEAAPGNPRAARLVGKPPKAHGLAVETAAGPSRDADVPYLEGALCKTICDISLALGRRFPRAALRPPLMDPDLAGALLV